MDVLRSHGATKFDKLLVAVVKTPAMLFWLDNNLNVKGKPNENFGRELMELFTIGIGQYTERDVQEVARAFTGWGYGFGAYAGTENAPRRRNETYYFDAKSYEDGLKTIVAKTANLNGDDVLKVLANHPQTALYISQKMWEFFGVEKPEKVWV